MDRDKRRKLERAGWKVGSAAELLGLTEQEALFVELKVALARSLRDRRGAGRPHRRRHLLHRPRARPQACGRSKIELVIRRELLEAAEGVHTGCRILFGEDADRLQRAWGNATLVERVGDLEEAVRRAAKTAKPGDCVLLSPACASFDMYPNFEKRGEHFIELVHALEAEAGA